MSIVSVVIMIQHVAMYISARRVTEVVVSNCTSEGHDLISSMQIDCLLAIPRGLCMPQGIVLVLCQ